MAERNKYDKYINLQLGLYRVIKQKSSVERKKKIKNIKTVAEQKHPRSEFFRKIQGVMFFMLKI